MRFELVTYWTSLSITAAKRSFEFTKCFYFRPAVVSNGTSEPLPVRNYEDESNENIKYFLFFIMEDIVC